MMGRRHILTPPHDPRTEKVEGHHRRRPQHHATQYDTGNIGRPVPHWAASSICTCTQRIYRKLMLITATQTNPTSSTGLNADRHAQTMGTMHMCQAIRPRRRPQGQMRPTVGRNSVLTNIPCEHVQRDRRSSGSLDDWIRRSTAKLVTPLAPSQSRSRKT